MHAVEAQLKVILFYLVLILCVLGINLSIYPLLNGVGSAHAMIDIVIEGIRLKIILA